MFVLVNQKGPDGLPMVRLLAESGPLQGKMFKLKGQRAQVGSAPSNEVHIPLPNIAANHFDIEVQGDNIVLHDRGSQGGTIVNEQPVSGSIYLQHGDKIAFGAVASAGGISISPFAASPQMQEIFLSEQSVNPVDDDVMTILGSPLARWGSSQPPPQPKANLRPPPGPPGMNATVLPASQPEPQSAWRQRKLEVMLAVGKALSRPEDISKKIDRVLELLFDTMDIDRAAVLVLSNDTEEQQKEQDEAVKVLGSMAPQYDEGADRVQIGAWSFSWHAYRDKQGSTEPLPLSSTVIDKVLKDAVAVMTQDAQAEDWLDSARSVFGQAIRTCICTPLKTSSGVLGVLYADSSRTSTPFSRDDMEFFTAFSNQAAVAIENTRLLHVALQKERMEQDLRVAKRIQQWLLPQQSPSLYGFELAGNSLAMEDVGGDYFDYIMLDEKHLALVVADVSGHGISSALVMTMTRSILRGSLMPGLTPADILMRVNTLVSDDMITRMFVTMMLAVVDLETGHIVFSNAGHNPPLVYRAYAQQVETLVPEGRRIGPLGMSRWARLKPEYQNQQTVLHPGDILCLYTDGFPEATNPAGEEMDIQPLEEVLAYYAQYPASTVLQQAFVRLHHFMAGSPSSDDTTAIILKRTH